MKRIAPTGHQRSRMPEHLDLDRRFGLLTRYTVEELLASDAQGRRITWDQVLQGRLSLITARANFGKTSELLARARDMRRDGKLAVFVPLHRLLSEANFAEALDAEDDAAYTAWKAAPTERLFLFADSLDEAALGRDEGLRVALRRAAQAVDWPNPNVTWALSSRPALLTHTVLEILQSELRAPLFSGEGDGRDQSDADAPPLFAPEPGLPALERSAQEDGPHGLASAGSVERAPQPEHGRDCLKIYALLRLGTNAARLYLSARRGVADPDGLLLAARRFGLGGLTDGPGGLDVLAFVDLVNHPPRDLTDAFERMVGAVQEQQRADRRERLVGNPSPTTLAESIEKLASASAMCQLPNIEIGDEALTTTAGALAARPLVGSLLSQYSLGYLLGSRLFIDSGHHQVKLYPDELLPYLAAKRLSRLARSPEDASRLLANFTWSASTGERGVHKVHLPVAGWLSTFNPHCRQALLEIEPQAVAFFGDLRSSLISLEEASSAISASIERLVSAGDALGRRHYTLTAENFWQAGKAGIEPTLLRLFERHGADWHARDALLDIATHARLEILRGSVMAAHTGDHAKLMRSSVDLHYILSLGRADDAAALAHALLSSDSVGEQTASMLVSRLAWKSLSARQLAEVADAQFEIGRGGFHLSWAMTHEVAESARPPDLYALTRALLLRLARALKRPGGPPPDRPVGHEFAELVMDMLALTIDRMSAPAPRLARLALVLHRLARRSRSSGAKTGKLRSALQTSAEVRRLLLRGLINSTDRSEEGVWKALFLHGNFVTWVDGDDAALGEPAFTALVSALRPRAAPTHSPRPRQREGPKLAKRSLDQLLSAMEGLRDASNQSALAWVAAWLVQTGPSSRYGECDLSVLEAEAGMELATAVRQGLSALWRKLAPTWNEAEPNSTRHLTVAGLQGLHLDLGDGTALPALTEHEACQAMRYAPFEINGLPKWFWPLASAFEPVAIDELRALLGRVSLGAVSADKAQALAHSLGDAPRAFQRALTADVWTYARSSSDIDKHATDAALALAMGDGSAVDRDSFEREASGRIVAAFEAPLQELGVAPVAMSADEARGRQGLESLLKARMGRRANAIAWGACWLNHFPDSLATYWEAWRATDRRAAEDFMFDLAADLGEDRRGRLREAAGKGAQGLAALARLYNWVSSVVREADDIAHDEGRAYWVGSRDQAQRLRDALLPAIASAKSQAAYDTLEVLRGAVDEARAKYIRQLQFNMREEEAAVPPLAQQDYDKFERDFAPPVTGYMSFAQAIHNDLLAVKRRVERGEFSLRRFFNAVTLSHAKTDTEGLALEEDFQALLGNELDHACLGRYGVALEPILPDSTRRDVLCQSGDLRATIELKMSLRWTLADYLASLEHQLKSQYMQAANSKIGFFVVVLQRERRWDAPGGGNLDFDALLAALSSKARALQAADAGLFLRVIGIDATSKSGLHALRARSNPGSATAPRYSDQSGNVWSGRGRRPKWLVAAIASGRRLDEFLTAS